MASYLTLEDSGSLNAKIDEKASDLFKARKRKPQLQVTKCYKRTTEEGKGTMCIERDQDVRNMFELKTLRHVRELVLSNSRYSRVSCYNSVSCYNFVHSYAFGLRRHACCVPIAALGLC
jgi:hypothetical protein